MKSITTLNLFFILIMICPLSGFARNTWMRTYGGTGLDEGAVFRPTNDNGFIVVGYTISFDAGNGDAYLIKTNSNGDTLWTKTYGGPGIESGSDVEQTSDNEYIIVGYTSSFGSGGFDLWLIKTDTNADTM